MDRFNPRDGLVGSSDLQTPIIRILSHALQLSIGLLHSGMLVFPAVFRRCPSKKYQ